MSKSPAPPSTCPVCGAALPATETAGLCPRCLMAEVMAPTADGARTVAVPPQVLPVAELAPHFPQLELLECIGRGGMGVVYKARQKALNRVVALKLLAPGQEKEESFAARFVREAQALAALSHPNIVTIYDFGEAGGFYYLLMEFIDGVNLRQAMKAGRFTPEQALAIVPPVCEALQYAHEHGIVHRDIKPENLLLDKDGRIKIADFGIAKMLDTAGTPSSGPAAQDAHHPGDSQPVGTPQYMAPEQKDHGSTDHRADIYSLGVVLYELLTGELPADRLQPPSRKVTIDVRLDEIVLRALERTPELRFQTAGEFRTQVELLATGSAPLPPEPSPSPLAPAVPRHLPWTLWLVCVLFTAQGARALIGMTLLSSATRHHIDVTLIHLVTGLALLSLRPGWWRFALILNGLQLITSVMGGLYVLVGGDPWHILPPGLTGTWRLAPPTLFSIAVYVIIHMLLMRLRKSGLFQSSRKAAHNNTTNPAGTSRLSRTALAGFLVWILSFAFIAIAVAAIISASGRQVDSSDVIRVAPRWFLTTLLCLVPAVIMPVVATILGCLAVVRIQRSAGQLYGMALALFDALLLPVIAILALVVWLFWWVYRVLLYPARLDELRIGGLPVSVSNIESFVYLHWTALIIISTILVGVPLALLLIHKVWRTLFPSPTVPSAPRHAPWPPLAIIGMGFACLSGILGSATWAQMPVPSQPLVWSILVAAVLGLLLSIPVRRSTGGKQALIVAALNIAIWLIVAFASAFQSDPPAAASRTFGPETTCFVPDPAAGKACLLDFETGQLMTPPDVLAAKFATGTADIGSSAVQWLRDSGADAVVKMPGDNSLRLIEAAAVSYTSSPDRPLTWSQCTPGAALAALRSAHWEQQQRFINSDRTFYATPAIAPQVLFFITREGSKGVMEIEPRAAGVSGVTLRYKLLNDTASTHPARTAVTFGPVIERAIPFDRGYINFQTGAILRMDLDNAALTDEGISTWMQQTGADAMPEEIESRQRLVGMRDGCVFVTAASPDFESVPASLANSALTVTESNLYWGFAEGTSPHWFRTRDGATGVLQLMGLSENPRALKLRYKLITNAPLPPAAFGPIVERVVPSGAPCCQQYFQFKNGITLAIGNGPGTTKEEYEADSKKAEDAGGIDMSALSGPEGIQIVGEGCIFTRHVTDLNWDTTTAEFALSAINRASYSYGVVEPRTNEIPITYLFKTSRNEIGIMQVLGVVEDERGYHGSDNKGHGMKFRYKLVQSSKF